MEMEDKMEFMTDWGDTITIDRANSTENGAFVLIVNGKVASMERADMAKLIDGAQIVLVEASK